MQRLGHYYIYTMRSLRTSLRDVPYTIVASDVPCRARLCMKRCLNTLSTQTRHHRDIITHLNDHERPFPRTNKLTTTVRIRRLYMTQVRRASVRTRRLIDRTFIRVKAIEVRPTSFNAKNGRRTDNSKLRRGNVTRALH